MTTVGVGMCPTSQGAVLAVAVRNGPACSVVAVAEVTWPAGMWSWSPPEREAATAAAVRLLGGARRRLGLRRWCPVAVAGGDGGPAGSEVALQVGGVLARSGLTLAGPVTAEEARAWAAADVDVPPELDERAAHPDGVLAVGAALSLVADVPVTRGPGGGGRHDPVDASGDVTDASEVADASDVADGGGGWLVEYLGETVPGSPSR
jgi:hypothetical protein